MNTVKSEEDAPCVACVARFGGVLEVSYDMRTSVLLAVLTD